MNAPAKLASAFLVSTLAALLLAGCGEKQADVVRPFRPQYEAFKKQLAEMAAQEPKAAVRLPAPLNPKPALKDTDSKSNTAVFLFQQLTDIRYGLPTPDPLDPFLGAHVLTQLRVATAPEDRLGGTARVKQKEELIDGLATRYIGAVKILSHQPGVMVGTEGFRGGKIQAVIMLFDRQPTTKLVFADSVTAANNPQIDARVFKDKPLTQQSGQGWVDVNLKKNFKNAVLAKFAEGTGGTFESHGIF